MTGIELAPEAPTPPAPGMPRRRLRLPASRQGMTWLVVLLAVGTLLAVQFGRQVYLNWESGQQAAALEAQIADVEAANDRLEQELAYLRSGHKTVLPPFEPDPTIANQLLNEVPVSYLVLDNFGPSPGITERYVAPVTAKSSANWRLVFTAPDNKTEVYERLR